MRTVLVSQPHALEAGRPKRPGKKIHTLQVKLLQVNAALRLKTVYCERLEFLVRQRNQRIDSLYGQLISARQQNQKLEAECEHLAQLVARPAA